MGIDDRPLFMISIVAQMLSIHPQTLRLYEREGFVKPSRTDGNTRLYSQKNVEQIRLILRLTRELGINLAGVEVILSMREKIDEMQREMDALSEFIKEKVGEDPRLIKEKAHNSLVKSSPGKMIKVKIEKEG